MVENMPYLCESRFERWISYFVMFFCLSLSELTFKYGDQAYLNSSVQYNFLYFRKCITNADQMKDILAQWWNIFCWPSASVFIGIIRQGNTWVYWVRRIEDLQYIKQVFVPQSSADCFLNLGWYPQWAWLGLLLGFAPLANLVAPDNDNGETDSCKSLQDPFSS